MNLTLVKEKEKKRKEKRCKIYGYCKKEAKLSLFPKYVIFYLENSNVSGDKRLEFNRQFKMLAGYSKM